jgi:hypothetical protein
MKYLKYLLMALLFTLLAGKSLACHYTCSECTEEYYGACTSCADKKSHPKVVASDALAEVGPC